MMIPAMGDAIVAGSVRVAISSGLLLREWEKGNIVEARAIKIVTTVVEKFVEDVLAGMDMWFMADKSNRPPRISRIHRTCGKVQIRKGRALGVFRSVAKEVGLFGRLVA
jgi:hypothetical protein